MVQKEVLSLWGRYGTVTDTLGVEETRITDGGREVRYLLCRVPLALERLFGRVGSR